MPDLRIGKVIFEPKKNNIRRIFQLTIDELQVIEEIDDGSAINKTARSYRIHDLDEYMYLENLFLELFDYCEEIDPNERNRSRLDYTYNNGIRTVRLVHDDGPSVKPWLDILEFIRDKLGIDFTSSSKGIGVSSGSIPACVGKGASKKSHLLRDTVIDIISSLPEGDAFDIEAIRERVYQTGNFDGEDPVSLFNRIYAILKTLIERGVITKIDKRFYQ